MSRRLVPILIALVLTHLQVLRADPTEDALKIGLEALDKGEAQSALTTFLNAYNERASARTERDATCMLLLAHAGKLLSNSNQHPAAAACFERFYGISVALNGNTHPHTVIAAVHLAHYLGRAGQSMDFGKRLCQEAMIACQLQPEIPPHVHLRALYTYGDILLAQKERIAAAGAFRDYLKHAEAMPKKPRVEMSEVYTKLASIDTFFGRAKDAEKRQKLALEQLRLARGDKDVAVYTMRLSLADQMAPADGADVLQALLKDVSTTPGVETSKELQQIWCAAEFRLALKEAALNQRAGLIARLRSAIAHGIKGYGEDHEQLLQLYLELAKLHLSKDQNKEGVECYRHVLAIRIKALGPDHESVATTRQILDDLIADLKKAGEDI
ncbi:MAG: hypothetical protein JNG86_00060 [Verrucomicrobiaceae bacterium]|nr:hypothetical protein [Verrucomicrobiaceae bacterium]